MPWLLVVGCQVQGSRGYASGMREAAGAASLIPDA